MMASLRPRMASMAPGEPLRGTGGSTMSNPILNELIGREQDRDRLKRAEQIRLAKTEIARQPARRFDLRTPLGNLSIAVRYLFKALARAD
jgi:hypothetical protein